MTKFSSADVATHLCRGYPKLSPLFLQLGPITKIKKRQMPVAEAVAKVTIGQMLSGKAAATIYSRVQDAVTSNKVIGSWQLDEEVMKRCGVSSRKIRTIHEFGIAYEAEPHRYEKWSQLSAEELFREVSGFWGLSEWSASILGIFYFGHHDIFPKNDGSINRAIELLRERGLVSERGRHIFDHTIAAPYRSYLALYLWKMLDTGILRREA